MDGSSQENRITAPELLTVSPSPHIRHGDTSRSIMLDVIIALCPALVWAVYRFGYRALVLSVIGVASSVFFEWLFNAITHRKQTVGDLSACVTGLLLALNLPVNAQLWMPVLGSAFAIVIVKCLFGGIGKNIVNPALAGRVFLFLSFSRTMSDFSTVDGIAGATPLKALKAGALSDVPLVDMLIGNMDGSIGEISKLLLAAGGCYLLLRRVITWHIPAAFIGTVALLSFVFPANQDALSYAADQLLSGGLVLGAFFMATDYATTPLTKTGKLIFGAGCGLITYFIRRFGGYAEGVSFAIMIMNLLVWPIDRITKPVPFGGKKNAEKK